MTYAERVAAVADNPQALLALAIELAGQLTAIEAEQAQEDARRARRTSDRRRQRAAMRDTGHTTSPDVARHAATNGDIVRQPATSPQPPSPPLVPLSSPRTLLNPSDPPPPSERSERDENFSENAPVPDIGASSEHLALALSTALGVEYLVDVKRFLATRRSQTVTAWMREMLKLIGPGSQFLAEDLAGACDDALACDPPISGPHALRAFAAKRRQERIDPPASRAVHGVTVQNAEEVAAAAKHRNGLVEARRHRGDGDRWWDRMQRDAKAAGQSPWSYAFPRIAEPADLGEKTA